MKRDSLTNVAVRNAGLLKGSQAAAVVVSWAVAEVELGHKLGHAEGGHLTAAVREYADHWRMSERTAWRELRRFKAAFPGEEHPGRLAAVLRSAVDLREHTQSEAAIVPLAIA
jgi:hypothetical protein